MGVGGTVWYVDYTGFVEAYSHTYIRPGTNLLVTGTNQSTASSFVMYITQAFQRIRFLNRQLRLLPSSFLHACTNWYICYKLPLHYTVLIDLQVMWCVFKKLRGYLLYLTLA